MCGIERDLAVQAQKKECAKIYVRDLFNKGNIYYKN